MLPLLWGTDGVRESGYRAHEPCYQQATPGTFKESPFPETAREFTFT